MFKSSHHLTLWSYGSYCKYENQLIYLFIKHIDALFSKINKINIYRTDLSFIDKKTKIGSSCLGSKDCLNSLWTYWLANLKYRVTFSTYESGFSFFDWVINKFSIWTEISIPIGNKRFLTIYQVYLIHKSRFLCVINLASICYYRLPYHHM